MKNEAVKIIIITCNTASVTDGEPTMKKKSSNFVTICFCLYVRLFAFFFFHNSETGKCMVRWCGFYSRIFSLFSESFGRSLCGTCSHAFSKGNSIQTVVADGFIRNVVAARKEETREKKKTLNRQTAIIIIRAVFRRITFVLYRTFVPTLFVLFVKKKIDDNITAEMSAQTDVLYRVDLVPRMSRFSSSVNYF